MMPERSPIFAVSCHHLNVGKSGRDLTNSCHFRHSATASERVVNLKDGFFDHSLRMLIFVK